MVIKAPLLPHTNQFRSRPSSLPDPRPHLRLAVTFRPPTGLDNPEHHPKPFFPPCASDTPTQLVQWVQSSTLDSHIGASHCV